MSGPIVEAVTAAQRHEEQGWRLFRGRRLDWHAFLNDRCWSAHLRNCRVAAADEETMMHPRRMAA